MPYRPFATPPPEDIRARPYADGIYRLSSPVCWPPFCRLMTPAADYLTKQYYCHASSTLDAASYYYEPNTSYAFSTSFMAKRAPRAIARAPSCAFPSPAMMSYAARGAHALLPGVMARESLPRHQADAPPRRHAAASRDMRHFAHVRMDFLRASKLYYSCRFRAAFRGFHYRDNRRSRRRRAPCAAVRRRRRHMLRCGHTSPGHAMLITSGSLRDSARHLYTYHQTRHLFLSVISLELYLCVLVLSARRAHASW